MLLKLKFTLYHPKASENQRFSDIFRGCKVNFNFIASSYPEESHNSFGVDRKMEDISPHSSPLFMRYFNLPLFGLLLISLKNIMLRFEERTLNFSRLSFEYCLVLYQFYLSTNFLLNNIFV